MTEFKKLKMYSWKLKMVYWKLKIYSWKLKTIENNMLTSVYDTQKDTNKNNRNKNIKNNNQIVICIAQLC